MFEVLSLRTPFIVRHDGCNNANRSFLWEKNGLTGVREVGEKTDFRTYI
jgi:hypothetical protein